MEQIEIKIDDIYKVAAVLSDLTQVNTQPHLGHLKRKLYKLQPEVNYIQQAEQDDLEAVKDNKISLGEPMPCPPHFLEQHEEVLEMLCEKVNRKESQIEKLIDNG